MFAPYSRACIHTNFAKTKMSKIGLLKFWNRLKKCLKHYKTIFLATVHEDSPDISSNHDT